MEFQFRQLRKAYFQDAASTRGTSAHGYYYDEVNKTLDALASWFGLSRETNLGLKDPAA